jgi:putative DNA primase/helicase
VRTGAVDIEALRRDRDQLWAEAAKAETENAALVLPQELWGDARAEQEERRVQDPWDDLLADVKGHNFTNDVGDAEYRIASDELLTKHLQIPGGKIGTNDSLRLKRAMRRNGWKGPDKLWFGGKQRRGYFRNVS